MYANDCSAQKLSNELFKSLDNNKNGFLDQRELLQARSIMLAGRDDSQLMEVAGDFSRIADNDHDGKISNGEWHEFMASVYAVVGRKHFLSLAHSWISVPKRHGPVPPAPHAPAPHRAIGLDKPTRCVDAAPVKVAQSYARASSVDKMAGCTVPPLQQASIPPRVAKATGSNDRDVMNRVHASAQACDSRFRDLAVAQTARTSKVLEGAGARILEGAARTKAATEIQKHARGFQIRSKLAAVKVALETKRTNEKTVPWAHHGPQQSMTVAELWDEFTVYRHGGIVTSVEVADILEDFQLCRKYGLNMELVKTMPPLHRADDKSEPEDLSVEEAAHLCTMLYENSEVDEKTARREIEGIKHTCRGPHVHVQQGRDIAPKGHYFGFKRFARFVHLVGALMHVDTDIVVALFAYVTMGVFQLPQAMHKLILARCIPAEVIAKRDQQAKPAVLGLSEFLQLVRRGVVGSGNGQHSISWQELQYLFLEVHKNVTTLLKERAKALKWAEGTDFKRDPDGLVGCQEVAILLQELAKTRSMAGLFASPFHMCIRLLQNLDT